MINEVALVLLWGLFGAKIALIYIGTGMVVAITGGFILGRIPAVEKMVEDYVWEIRMGEVVLPELTWKDRFEQAPAHPGYPEAGDPLRHPGHRRRGTHSWLCAH